MTDTDRSEGGRPARQPAASARSGVAYEVPADRSSVECEHCGRPFAGEALLALHRGHAHADALSGPEREAFENAYDAESKQLRRFRLKALSALVALYFGLLMVYALVI